MKPHAHVWPVQYAIEADPGRCTASFPVYPTEEDARAAADTLDALSGWCPPDGHTEAQHRVCQMRQNDPDERIRLRPCGCEEHGGHATTTTEEPTG